MAMNRPSGFGGGMGGLSPHFTRTGRMIAIYYAAVFLMGVLTSNWLDMGWFPDLLVLYPLGSGSFAPWQLVTHMLVYWPLDLFNFLLNMLMLWLFAWQVEAQVGRGRFLRLVFGIPLVTGLIGLPFTMIGSLHGPFAGFSLVLDVLIVAFCVMNRHAIINFFFVLPMRAGNLIWVIIGFHVLTFLMLRNPWLVYQLIAIGLTWVSFRRGLDFDPELWRLRWKERRLKKKMGKFSVIHGGRRDDDDGPMYH